MSKFAIKLLTLAMCTAALLAVPMVAPANAATHSGKHMKHKKIHRHFGASWSAGQPWPVARPYYRAGRVCPGMGRSFDCATWPPPYDEDPDRKVTGRR
jgi:hypothetical protein